MTDQAARIEQHTIYPIPAGGISDRTGIVLIALLSLAAAVYGYDLIHAYARWMTWFCRLPRARCEPDLVP